MTRRTLLKLLGLSPFAGTIVKAALAAPTKPIPPVAPTPPTPIIIGKKPDHILAGHGKRQEFIYDRDGMLATIVYFDC